MGIEDALETGGLQTTFTHPPDQAFYEAGGGDDTVVVGGTSTCRKEPMRSSGA
ncbi:hypothetical protein [Streptomyces sp. NPDC001635]